MPTHFIYPIYAGILAVILMAVVPRAAIKELFIYALTFGAVVNVGLISVLTNLLGVGGHINRGPFGALGLPFFPPIAWSVWFLLFFYFLPELPAPIILYTATAAGTSVLFSNVLANLHIFEWNYGRVLVPLLIYGSWFSFSVYAFRRLRQS